MFELLQETMSKAEYAKWVKCINKVLNTNGIWFGKPNVKGLQGYAGDEKKIYLNTFLANDDITAAYLFHEIIHKISGLSHSGDKTCGDCIPDDFETVDPFDPRWVERSSTNHAWIWAMQTRIWQGIPTTKQRQDPLYKDFQFVHDSITLANPGGYDFSKTEDFLNFVKPAVWASGMGIYPDI
jgi:hypothetical protein